MNHTPNNKRRLPAEWEEQDGVLLAWPHAQSDWQPLLQQVEPVFAAIIAAISRFETVILIVPDENTAVAQLTAAATDLDRVTFVTMATDDTWARDFGPITVHDGPTPLLLDFGFNGWGNKFPAQQDDRINRNLAKAGVFRSPMTSVPLFLEGGSIESDGSGTLLVTRQCLLNPNRNLGMTQAELERILALNLGADRFLWLQHGYLAGDDTDSHIDTLARLCPDDTIVYVACDDPADEHFQELAAMKSELGSFRTRAGAPYRLLPLPLPAPCYGLDQERIPVTYANFLIINSAVLVPTYNDPNDAKALAVLRRAFPQREIIGIHCLPAVLQHGSLHCLTMQLPKGTLT
jgi:agmatine deiminase